MNGSRVFHSSFITPRSSFPFGDTEQGDVLLRRIRSFGRLILAYEEGALLEQAAARQ